MMDSLLRAHTAAYLNDVVIYSRTWEEHLQHIRSRLARLREASLTIKRKCQFGMHSCTYLGHVVGNSQVNPELVKVDAVRTFPQPTSKKQVRACLGLSGYYRKFVPGFANTATPLTDFSRKNSPSCMD